LSEVGVQVDRRSAAVRTWLTRGLTVVVYHEITDTPSPFQRVSGGFVTPAVFERQIRWMGERFEFIAPTDLPHLSGQTELPRNAALLTFDDAWPGVFRTALPILRSLEVPAIYFLNMATVHGAPDLAAVRRYERLTRPEKTSTLDRYLDINAAAPVLAEIDETYRENPEFLRFQGATAILSDLELTIVPEPQMWLGSHLFHHWEPSRVASELFADSAQANRRALAAFPNALGLLATPYGDDIEWTAARSRALGASALLIATGGQNDSPSAPVLDRLELERGPSGPRDWWWSAHRRRLFGGT
jgi:peptidoglycan/xylan/chitin deacetylase (PgdA/CDA1 family)